MITELLQIFSIENIDERVLEFEDFCKQKGTDDVYDVAYFLSDHNFIDYGVSLRTGWITQKGVHLLIDRLEEEISEIEEFIDELKNRRN